MSNFDFGDFYGDNRIFAVNKKRYAESEADALFVRELEIPLSHAKKITGYVYYGIGYDEDHEKIHGYWFSGVPCGRHPQECWAYIL